VTTSTHGSDFEPLLHSAQVARLLAVSLSWLAKSGLNGTGPRFTKVGRSVRYTSADVRDLVVGAQRNSTSEGNPGH
jgi:hypothetical protein